MQYDCKEQLTGRFIAAVDYLNRQMHTCGLDDWEGLDMTIPQIKTLVLLERSGPLRMGNIAAFLDRALSATTTVIDRLVEKELVDRAWGPRRSQSRYLQADRQRTARDGTLLEDSSGATAVDGRHT